MKREDVVRAISEKTDFYKKDVREILEAFEEVIIENMNEATYEEPSELYLAHGFLIGGKRYPEREVKDPRTQEVVVTEEKVLPYSRYKVSFKQKINERGSKNGL